MGSTQRVILALSVLAIGCSSSERQPAGGHSSPAGPTPLEPSGPPIELPHVAPAPPAEVQLLNPGAQPRRLLRYHPQVGSTDELRITSSYDMSISSGEHKMFSQTERSVVLAQIRVTKRDANGDVHLAISVRELEAKLEGMAFQPRKKLQTVKGTAVVSDRGVVKHQHIPDMTGGANRRDDLSLNEYFHTLPTEPVGVGASWKTTRKTVRNGMSMRSVETATITAIKGDVIETRQQAHQLTNPQLLTNDSLPASMLMEAGKMKTRGAGTATLRLDRAVLGNGSYKMRAGADMRRRHPTQIYDMRFSLSADIRVERP